ncbi:zinc finger matrin-type protein 2 [Senna tora]|uniref:Zinc finger matrin-type protein 2 n=1 Tax=Senna tora TaxID=362788 RepID=A0A835C5P3_9FABA|nr:zinc finger matrin-type protein 2 [Senna tora]
MYSECRRSGLDGPVPVQTREGHPKINWCFWNGLIEAELPHHAVRMVPFKDVKADKWQLCTPNIWVLIVVLRYFQGVGVQRIHPHEVHGRVGGLEPTMGSDPMPTCVPRSGNLRFPSVFCLSHCTAHDTSEPVLQNPNSTQGLAFAHQVVLAVGLCPNKTHKLLPNLGLYAHRPRITDMMVIEHFNSLREAYIGFFILPKEFSIEKLQSVTNLLSGLSQAHSLTLESQSIEWKDQIKLDSGSITYNDKPYTKSLKQRIGYVTQDDVVFPHLTVKETLTYVALLCLSMNLSRTQKKERAVNVLSEAGYYCSVCECVVKDSANYLDHINGKKHQRALGMSMRVERASIGQKEKEVEEAPETDPDVAAMMGFGGFRSSKK